jgi:hypothetical protein
MCLKQDRNQDLFSGGSPHPSRYSPSLPSFLSFPFLSFPFPPLPFIMGIRGISPGKIFEIGDTRR